MVTVVAEIGTGHNGDLERGYRLIDMAARCGADVAKFQYVLAYEIVHPNTGTVPLPGGDIPLYSRFRALEQPPDFYQALREHCRSVGIGFLCTPFGVESARALHRMAVDRIKIASPELNHLALLQEVSRYGVPLLVSTGVSKLADIELAVSVLQECHLTLLHCVTAYPAPEEDYNLRVLPLLSGMFGVPVGVSDHSLDPSIVASLAVAYGATVVEKHVTLSREDQGLDDPIAQDRAGFSQCVQEIRRAEIDGLEETVRRWSRDVGARRVEAVLGTGVKRLSASEEENYERTNRSIHAVRSLRSGDVLRPDDIAVLRTEKLLRPGLHPRYAERIVGSVLSRDVPDGEGIRLEDLLNRPATDFHPAVST